jgi:hypothetical protein
MTLHSCTECTFDVEAGWVEKTGYSFKNGAVQVTIGPFTPVAEWAGKLDKAAETFRLSLPAPGAEIFVHRMGGKSPRFELSLFWPLRDTIWVFRARGPWDAEEVCREVSDRFIETYEIVPRRGLQ